MTASADVVEAAIAQIDQGFAVFALATNSKVPATLNGFKNATRNPDWIRTQLGAATAGNYGLVWPEDAPQRVVVFDLDDGGGASTPWRDRLLDLVARHGPLPRTKFTETPSGGRHAFYRWPSDVGIPPGDELFGFTVRWPGRGYLVGPGSSIEGRPYRAGDVDEIAELPAGWVAAAQTEHPARAHRNGEFVIVQGGFALPDRIPAGRRYASVRDYIASRYNSGLTPDELWSLVKSEVAPRFVDPKPEHELRGDFERATAKISERLGAPARGGPTGEDAVAAVTPILFRNLSTIAVEAVGWLWFRHLPIGSVTLFDGNPGEGKSTVVADLIARLTRGTTWPDETPVGPPGPVLYVTKEDDPATQVRPRIEAAGGDVTQVYFVAADLLFPRDLPRFREVLEELRPRLVVLDPLMSYLEGKVRTVSDNEVRSALMTPLGEAARDTGCAILVIRHFNKGSGQSALLRGAGSLGGLAGAARMVLALATDPDSDDDKARVFGVVKSNHEAKPPSLRAVVGSAPVEGFQMTVSRVAWHGASATSVTDLMERSREEHQLVLEAETALHKILEAADEPLPSSTVHAAMKAQGHSRTAVYNAAKALRVHVDRSGFPATTTWALPVVSVVTNTRTTETTDGRDSDSPVNLPPDDRTTETTGSTSHPSQSSHISGAVASRAPERMPAREERTLTVVRSDEQPTVECFFPQDHSTAWNRDPAIPDRWYCSICHPPLEARPVIVIGQQHGPRNARTDPATGIRWYTWRGVEYPSVTTVRRLAGIPHRLAEWQISQVAARALERMGEYSARLATGDPDEAKAVRQELRQAAVAKREARAALGTAVHQAIEGRMGLSVVGSDIAPRLGQFLDWRAASGVEILGQELQVWSPVVGYAGSVDLLGRFPDGSVWVVDYKTGDGLYADQLLQLLAYLMADFVGEDDVVDEPMTELFHQAKGVALLHLEDGGWEFRSLEATPEAWGAFRGLLTFSRWMAAHPEIEDVTLGVKRGKA